MKQHEKELLIKYITSFSIASLITLVIFAIESFSTQNIQGNIIPILADGFSVSGILMLSFFAMIFISNEGAFIGIGYIIKNIVQAFTPMGRKNHELYADYRERKLAEKKVSSEKSVLIIGLLFLTIGIIFTFIWNI